MLGDSSRSIENWVNSYRKMGFNGLMESDHPGRPSRISGVMESIGEDLGRNPGVFGVFPEHVGRQAPDPPPPCKVWYRHGHKTVPADIPETWIQDRENEAGHSKGGRGEEGQF